MSVGPTGEKRTRFSLSHDEGSIGNTSDNLEAISEAASNHSVASSLEDEPDNPDAEDPINDNLSDMVSANVSGRGTPNVSGRDTPSSQITEDGAEESQNRQPRNDENINNEHRVSVKCSFNFKHFYGSSCRIHKLKLKIRIGPSP